MAADSAYQVVEDEDWVRSVEKECWNKVSEDLYVLTATCPWCTHQMTLTNPVGLSGVGTRDLINPNRLRPPLDVEFTARISKQCNCTEGHEDPETGRKRNGCGRWGQVAFRDRICGDGE